MCEHVEKNIPKLLCNDQFSGRALAYGSPPILGFLSCWNFLVQHGSFLPSLKPGIPALSSYLSHPFHQDLKAFLPSNPALLTLQPC